MANKKISELTAAGTLTGVELIEIVQGGLNVRATTQEVANLNGATREFNRAFSSELLFDKNVIHYAPHTLTGDTTFSIDPDSNDFTDESVIFQEIITDGTHAVFFENYNPTENVGFKFIPASSIQSGEIPPAGTYVVMFLKWRAMSIANWVVPSSEVANLTPLSAPANFAAVNGGQTSIDLTWDNNAFAEEIEIETSPTGAAPWTSVVSLSVGTTSYEHTPLSPGTAYFYRARWIGDGEQYANSGYSTADATTQDAGDVTPPTFSFVPADSATEVPVNKSIVITGNEAFRKADGTAITNANVADVLTVKRDTSGGADIDFLATISGLDMTVVPDTSWGDNDDVYVAVHDVEDVNGNEIAAPIAATFTTSDFTLFNGTSNRLNFGDIYGASLFQVNDTNFWLELTIRNYLTTAGNRILISKASGVDTNKTFNLYTVGADVRFVYYMSNGSARFINWANALDGDPHTLVLKYDGSIDTNNGLDRVILEIDGTPAGSKTIIAQVGASLVGTLQASTAKLAVSINIAPDGSPVSSSYYTGEAKDFRLRSNAGATLQISVDNLKEGTDASGNSHDGTWT